MTRCWVLSLASRPPRPRFPRPLRLVGHCKQVNPQVKAEKEKTLRTCKVITEEDHKKLCVVEVPLEKNSAANM